MKIIDKYWTIFGHEIHLRIEPPVFKRDLKNIIKLVDDGKVREAEEAIENAYRIWGSDAELIRIHTFNSFLNDDIDVYDRTHEYKI